MGYLLFGCLRDKAWWLCLLVRPSIFSCLSASTLSLAALYTRESSLLEPRSMLLVGDNVETTRWSKSEKIAKHADVRYHFLQDNVQMKTFMVCHCPSENMMANPMTKIALNTLWASLVFYQFGIGIYSTARLKRGMLR